jgi:hypothetical protein
MQGSIRERENNYDRKEKKKIFFISRKFFILIKIKERLC